MVDLSVNISKIKMKNPVMTASGTFGFGEEISKIFDIGLLGALVVKGITLKPKLGNKTPRLAETPSGMLNSIGLQNPGVISFIKDKLPKLRNYDVPILINISGKTLDEYVKLTKILNDESGIFGIEVNISCPNVKYKMGRLFAQDEKMVYSITKKVKKASKLPIIIKLSPEVTDIKVMAKAAEEGGADALSLINTITGMAIDINTKRPKLANITGGLSGPAIKPIGVRCVWQAYNTVKIPIIGMGGIMNTDDAIEYIIAGASAIAIGTGNFIDPFTCLKVIEGIENYLVKNKISSVKDLVGKLKIKGK
ncbi:MAG: dihydroorotate dehydrogenase [Candidatus Firestonebacteria bacterium]